MTQFVVHPVAAEVLGADGPRNWTLTELLAACAGLDDHVSADLAGRIEGSDLPITYEALVAAAEVECARRADIYLRCEYFLLGALSCLGELERLAAAREDLETLTGHRAFDAYLSLGPRHDGSRRPTLFFIAGLPGTGKSTLAERLAREISAPVFSMDWQLGALVPFGVLRDEVVDPLAEVGLLAAAARQLQLGLDVIVDATGHRTEDRRRAQELAEALGGRFIGVECVCSDEDVQRERLTSRSRGVPGWPATVPWEHVLRMRGLWEAWQEPHVVVDSAVGTPEAGAKQVRDASTRDR